MHCRKKTTSVLLNEEAISLTECTMDVLRCIKLPWCWVWKRHSSWLSRSDPTVQQALCLLQLILVSLILHCWQHDTSMWHQNMGQKRQSTCEHKLLWSLEYISNLAKFPVFQIFTINIKLGFICKSRLLYCRPNKLSLGWAGVWLRANRPKTLDITHQPNFSALGFQAYSVKATNSLCHWQTWRTDDRSRTI